MNKASEKKLSRFVGVCSCEKKNEGFERCLKGKDTSMEMIGVDKCRSETLNSSCLFERWIDACFDEYREMREMKKGFRRSCKVEVGPR